MSFDSSPAKQTQEEKMQLETERLCLVPLSARQIGLWTDDMGALEKELNCRYRAEPMEGLFLEIVRGQVEKTAGDTANYLYHTFWFLIRKTDRIVVGSADFKDMPDEQGEVEIGYGLGKDFEHRGYMTEAVGAMCAWALQQPGVSAVTAETDTDNPASQNILKRCGFSLYQQAETCWWRLPPDNPHTQEARNV
ncbi:GNAT family N-acetyltransferase [Treponema sp. OttesenSCG-928-L16]|nr:GNAT family N-acetyltransferase [Treponema sp. OttesenSCG-928-L16]